MNAQRPLPATPLPEPLRWPLPPASPFFPPARRVASPSLGPLPQARTPPQNSTTLPLYSPSPRHPNPSRYRPHPGFPPGRPRRSRVLPHPGHPQARPGAPPTIQAERVALTRILSGPSREGGIRRVLGLRRRGPRAAAEASHPRLPRRTLSQPAEPGEGVGAESPLPQGRWPRAAVSGVCARKRETSEERGGRSPHPGGRERRCHVKGNVFSLSKVHSLQYGLHLNIKKTKVLTTGPVSNIMINGERIEVVKDFILLGSTINSHGSSSQEIKRCIALDPCIVPGVLKACKWASKAQHLVFIRLEQQRKKESQK
ncbi:protein ALEX-like [Elephas maximus indicus]|uniref:protein ALEX-like n=1 Tax=Elephas maximus indicus TaxID=99487 RepID=UPI00211601B1|nr:protein ALEX-like [Elephas maximus indicus]